MMSKKFFYILSLIGLIILPSGAIESGNPALYYAYKGLEKFGVEDAWGMGYTGKGVNVAVIDSGIDFATPDLIGTQAHISNKSSLYYGWPIVIDLDSLIQYQQDSNHLFIRSRYANTSSTDVRGYQTTGTSKSDIYHIGDHPDMHLTQFHGQPVKVLLVDEKSPNIYDTVYVDLNNNHDFRDDKPCRKGDEISYWDRDNDGYPDESGGMIYFIADGKTPLPLSRMLYGEDTKIPKNGELVAFHYDDGSHGTMCTGIIAAQGKNIKGIAPDAKIIPIQNSRENDMLLYFLASLGYDGVPNTRDEADIISKSGGFSYLFNKGADEGSTFLEYLITNISPFTTMIFANGNDGSGYGTSQSPSSEHVINVGAIYDLWWNNSSYSEDVVCFSSRGPNALGQVKPNVLATGYLAPRVLPLWDTHSGKAAWNNNCGGTSGATPHVAAVMALIYQAYKEKYGEFPTSEKARDILMSSATDIDEEVFVQGSGIVNARKAIEIASGDDGVLIEPALLVTKPVEAGSNLKFNFTISNYSSKTIDLKPQILIKDKIKNLSFESTEENAFFPIHSDMLDCDLIKVSSYYPRDTRSTKLDKYEGFDIYLYNWEDRDIDGEVQESELEAIAVVADDVSLGFTSEVRMHHPVERSGDGIVAGLKRRGEIKNDEVHVVIETYKWKPWNIGINIDGNNVHVSIPMPNTTGMYQGKILLEYNGERQCIPVSFSTHRNDDIQINNTADIYENAKIYGRFEGEGKRCWDSRIYPIYHHGHDLATIDVTWEDPNTDIDVYLYGGHDFNTSKIWKFPTTPPIELPELRVLKENGHSMMIRGFHAIVRGDKYIGGGYSRFYTSTGENKEVISGILTEGLNLIVIDQVFSGGKKYGENVTININVTPFKPIDLKAKAGDIISFLPPGIDCIIGFSGAEEVKGEEFGFSPKAFQAEEGDVIIIRSNDTEYSPQIFFDSNENGTMDWGNDMYFRLNGSSTMDELIFAEKRYDDINPFYTDLIPIHKKGTYFLLVMNPYGRLELYHMKNRYENNSSASIKIKVPEQAGAYLGIAEKGGTLIPIPVKLTVEAGEPTSICLDAVNHTDRSLPFEVTLKVQDKFGNLVENTTTAGVEFNDATKKVDLVKGIGSINLTAPNKAGRYKVKVQSQYGIAEKDIEIADKALNGTGNTSINSPGSAEAISEAKETMPSDEKKDSIKEVQSVSVLSDSGNIRLTWQASEGVDHYNVYRLKDGAPEKLAEVKSPEYIKKGELWKSYTFRISAVNSEGNESELSDPVGIVVTP
ncbi:S8 family serine peptidase [Methanothrix soehngenii]|jgi:subtilisin family serine protease|uniref:Peptidase families S8 and S53, putative n=2 Tax=Methanothrix soehngenii TaxID=2223 RepID=F4BWE7_METSG|nr:S8 family serine peptidase [Methanothrix soehngenii]AEB69757.1 peptidase families S8 and S53, putative [Methanothrix soehngenii GP6]